ncbi:hypothetical protein B0H10DRAFT_1967530 [Mycena sp. CBHHK59/15]|nr:hypothetical protein B0H10DRAFT_1967530 [Mycena sp. CBHHK59/15]
MYGADPLHWILGWMELGAQELHMFDSTPELQSHMWAELALVEVGETVFTTLKQPSMDLASWKVIKHTPPKLQRQMNGWACGFIIIHAMDVVGNGKSISDVTKDQTENTQFFYSSSFRLPPDRLLRKPATTLPSGSIVQSDVDVELTVGKDLQMQLTVVDKLVEESQIPFTMEVENLCSKQRMGTEKLAQKFENPIVLSSKRKLATEEDMGSETENKRVRALRTSTQEREALLNDNEWTSVVEAHWVRCTGCTKWVKLHTKTKFKLENWTQHEIKCPWITERCQVRSAAVRKQYAGPVASGSASIHHFCPGILPTPPAGELRAGQESKETNQGKSDSDSESRSSHKKISYTSHIVNAVHIPFSDRAGIDLDFQTPSIARIFEPGPIKNPPPMPVIIREPKSCLHLFGDEYREYGCEIHSYLWERLSRFFGMDDHGT